MKSFNEKLRILLPSPRKTKNVLVALAMAGLINVGSVSTASANDPVGDFAHVIECIGLLITDEARHLAECGTNDFVYEPSADTPPPPPPPDCDNNQVVINGICTDTNS